MAGWPAGHPVWTPDERETDRETGAGNIADVGTTSSQRKDQDIIPDVAVRASQDTQDYHTGRGGAGNEHTSAERAKSPPAKSNGGATGEAPISLADKLKEKLFGAFKK